MQPCPDLLARGSADLALPFFPGKSWNSPGAPRSSATLGEFTLSARQVVRREATSAGTREYGAMVAGAIVTRASQKTGGRTDDKGARHYYVPGLNAWQCQARFSLLVRFSVSVILARPRLCPLGGTESRGCRSSTVSGPPLHNATLTRSAINESLETRRSEKYGKSTGTDVLLMKWPTTRSVFLLFPSFGGHGAIIGRTGGASFAFCHFEVK